MKSSRRSVSVPRHARGPFAFPKRNKTPPPREEKRPQWDDTTGDVSKLKLTAEELRKKKQERISKNRIIALAADRDTSSKIEDWRTEHGSPGSDDTSATINKPEEDQRPSINYGAVLQMLHLQPQQQSTAPAQAVAKLLSPEETAAAAADAMADAASMLPADLTLNPNFSLLGKAQTRSAAKPTGLQFGPLSSPGKRDTATRHAEVWITPAKRNSGDNPASSSIIKTADAAASREDVAGEGVPPPPPAHAATELQPTARASERTPPHYRHQEASIGAGSTGSAADGLSERQMQTEARISALESQLRGGEAPDMTAVQAELRRLVENNSQLRKELTEFSAHASTMMMHLHTQVAQLLSLQGLPSDSVRKPRASIGAQSELQHAHSVEFSAEDSPAEPRPAPGASSTAGWPVRPDPSSAVTWDTPSGYVQAQALRKGGGAGQPAPPARGGATAGLESGAPTAAANAASSWMFGGGDWNAADDVDTQPPPFASWNADAPMAKRSIFEDIPEQRAQALRPAPSPGFAGVNSARGRPVTDVDADLEKLPTFAAFRRSSVVTATSAVQSAVYRQLDPPGITFTAAAGARAALSPGPWLGGTPAAVHQSSPSVGSDGGWGLAQHMASGADLEAQYRQQATEPFASSVAAGGLSGLRPLPTQFQPRSLGHASILVQRGSQPVGPPGDRHVSPDGPRDGLRRGPVSQVPDPRGLTRAGGAAFDTLRNMSGGHSPPAHKTGPGSMSLAAHAAAAAAMRRGGKQGKGAG